MVHCENADAVDLWQRKVLAGGIRGPEGHALSRPSILEDEGTRRALSLAALAGAPLYVVHVMSAGASALIGAARNGRDPSFPFPQRVWGEAVVSGIAGDDSKVFDRDFRTAAASVMSPPIRSPRHREALRAALAGGDLSVLATDHAVFNFSQKKEGGGAGRGGGDFRAIPNGVNGIEERLVVAWDSLVAGGAADGMGSQVPAGLATPSRLVELVSAAPAKLFGLYPRKGVVAPGSDADLVLFDPSGETEIGVERNKEGNEKRKHHSRVDTNIYEGRKVKGKVATTIFRGEIVWNGEELTAQRGAGRRLVLPTFVDAVFGGLENNRRGGGESGTAADAEEEEDEEAAAFIKRWEREFPYGELPVRREKVGESLREQDEL